MLSMCLLLMLSNTSILSTVGLFVRWFLSAYFRYHAELWLGITLLADRIPEYDVYHELVPWRGCGRL